MKIIYLDFNLLSSFSKCAPPPPSAGANCLKETLVLIIICLYYYTAVCRAGAFVVWRWCTRRVVHRLLPPSPPPPTGFLTREHALFMLYVSVCIRTDRRRVRAVFPKILPETRTTTFFRISSSRRIVRRFKFKNFFFFCKPFYDSCTRSENPLTSLYVLKNWVQIDH